MISSLIFGGVLTAIKDTHWGGWFSFDLVVPYPAFLEKERPGQWERKSTAMIMNVLFGKAGITVLLIAFGIGGGMFLQSKVLAPKPPECPSPCPALTCPEPTVSVQPFDVEKIKNLKSFSYAPQFTGSVAVAGVDSIAVKRYIEQAILKAFEAHIITTDKKKRK